MKTENLGLLQKMFCDILGLTNPTEALKPLDNDEKNTLRISEGNRGYPNINVISESGFYTLVLRSNKSEAKPFRRWATHEVLPSIRKTGTYSLPSVQPLKSLLPPDFDSEVKKAVSIARIFGFRGNQAYLSANRMIIKLCGIDCLESDGT